MRAHATLVGTRLHRDSSTTRPRGGATAPLLCFTRPPPPALYTLSLHDALPTSDTAGSGATCAGPRRDPASRCSGRSEEHTSELQSHHDLVCRLLLEKKKRIDKSV